VCAGGGEDDGAVLVYELAAILRIAETFGKWQGRCEPLDCFGHVGVVQYWYYGGVRCRTVLLEHTFRRYWCLPGCLTRTRSATARASEAGLQ
jgi:hypothetical protein